MKNKRTISLIYWASGSGIEKDIRILTRTFTAAGYNVNQIVTHDRSSNVERIFRFLIQLPRLLIKRDIQIHVEQIHREQFRFAKTNILIPNPEITDGYLFHKIKVLPFIFCKSHQGARLFNNLGLVARYIGFTSEDVLNVQYRKDFRSFLHVAGASSFKGTNVVFDVWSRHPEWPKLTIIRTLKDCYGNPRPSLRERDNIEVIEHWVPEEQLTELQNSRGIHLCPSEMEGFGHYIAEGLSVGSVVVTTDAPPMNELVDDACGLCVRATQRGKSYMEDRWLVDPGALEVCIEKILAMPDTELKKMGKLARRRYEQLNREFPSNLTKAMDEI